MSNIPGTLEAEAQAFLDANPDVEEFTLIFTDFCGVQRGKKLRRVELLPAFRNGRFLPGSIMSIDITGADVEETGLVWDDGDADRIAVPVPGTLVRSPFTGDKAAQFMTYMTEQDGTLCRMDPRNVLTRVLEKFDGLGLVPVTAVELEFYLMDRDSALAGAPQPPKGLAVPYQPKHLQAYLLTDLDDFQPFFDDLYASAETQGLPVRTLISEYSPGQMEVVLNHRPDVMRAADEAIMFKRLVKSTALRHGLIASFMPKPYSAYSGCGMHMHVSLADKDGNNAFASEDPKGNALLHHAIGGLKDTMADFMGIWAPNANSYRRLRRNSYAPLAPSWGVNNRTVSLRIPAGGPETRHVEHRVAGADANPYLTLAALLSGIHLGITQKRDPGPIVEGNGYDTAAEPLPMNWYAATERLRNAKIAREYFGDDVVDTYCTIKEIEADRFYCEPTSLDFDWYLRNA